MYPATYYQTFMRYEASHEVFVAMPFSESFRRAFDLVIEPAIKAVSIRDIPLVPRIINRAISGAPDIHEKIFDAILHSRLVIADMTVQASCQMDDGSTRWQGNANVAYEVGLACAWRNPEDIVLIHQPHQEHSYSFDIQNLRHVMYRPDNLASVASLANEIVQAVNQSVFLARHAYQKLLQSVSPSAVQFMYQEAPLRAFPVIAFRDKGLPVMDARIHAATELLACGALRNRNVIPQGSDQGVAIVYEWTEIGLRMLTSLRAISAERRAELITQVASVPPGDIPPQHLRNFPEAAPETTAAEPEVDMVEATEVETEDEATTVLD